MANGYFAAPVPVTAGATYVASYRAPAGRYSYTIDGLRNPLDKAPLHTANTASRYTYGSGAPTSVSTANYFVDPVFTVAAGSAPEVISVSPADESTSVPVTTSVGVTFDQSIQPGTASVSLTDGAGNPVPGTMASMPLGPKASFTPTASLAQGKTYTVTVSGAKNLGGTPMTAPSITTFTTSGPTVCRCSLLSSSAIPVTSDSGDASPITVGLRFSADVDGVINGLRYYRDAANTGVHTGTLYTASGTVLATLTFPSASPGWQTATFSSPVPVTAGTTYVASAFMPVGHYSVAPNFFANPFVNSPLTGTLGTYAYGSDTFPTQSWNNNYYYVDVSFAPASAPAAPTAVSATKGDGSATVSWTAPTSDGGKPITSYTVIPFVGGTAQAATVVSGSPPATTALVAGLTNGSEYSFKVFATNSVGAGPQSAASAPVTPGPLPAAPTAVEAAAGDGSATVTWTAPTSDGGSPITSYSITPFIGSTAQSGAVVTASPTSTTATVPGLTPGISYSFRVASINIAGAGPAASSAAVTACPCSLLTASATPTVNDSGDNEPISVGLRFTAEVDGSIVGLRFYRNAANTGTHTGTLYSSDGTALSTLTYPTADPGWQTATFPSPVAITAGTTYVASTFMPAGHYSQMPNFFAAPVVNRPLTGIQGTFTYGGDAFPSSSFANTHYLVDVLFSTKDPSSAPTAPSAPSNVSATPGDSSATVSWMPPADGGSPITGYTVTRLVGGVAQGSVSTTDTSAKFTDLANGTSYKFSVTARNVLGTSPAGESPEVTPASKPSAPTGVTAVAGNTSAVVSWTAPPDGGSPITSYVVTTTGGADPPGPVNVNGTPPGDSTTITGLTNGTAYSFTVRALNTVGSSAESAASTPVTPMTVPDAPTAVTAIQGDASATVSWAAPANTGGSPITSYTVTPSAGSTALTPVTVSGTPPSTTLDVTGLTNGTTYTFTVRATNAAGDSALSEGSAPVTPAAPTAPAAPLDVTAAPASTSATVSWTAPSDGGSAITKYTITPYSGSTAVTSRAVTVTGGPPATTATVTGLTNGTPYNFRVTATNAIGTGPAGTSAAVTPAGVPSAPGSVVASPGDTSASVSWSAPSNNGSPITGYIVTPYIGTVAQAPVNAAASPVTINGLTNGTAYTFRVAAVNAVGTGATTTSGAVTPFGVPNAPTNLTGIAGNQAVYLSWSAPAFNGGSTITNYTVTRYVNGVSQGTRSAGTGTNLTVGSLTNGTTYTFTVTATNARGTGAASAASAGLKPFALFVQGLGIRATATTSIAATPAGNLTAGNRLVVMVGVKNTTTTTAQSVTDSAGNSYVRVAQFRGAGSDATTEMSVWTAPITAGAGTRPIVTARSSSSATMAITVTEYAGLSTASGLTAVDQSRTAAGSSRLSGTAQSGATGATTATGEVAVGFYLDGGPSRTISAGSGYTARVTGAGNSSMEYYIADQTIWPSGTTANAQFAISSFTTMPWLAATVVFKRGS